METKHTPATPLPWSRKDGHYHHVRSQDIDYFIHAANAYPKLVAMLRKLLEIAGAHGTEPHGIPEDEIFSLLRELGEDA